MRRTIFLIGFFICAFFSAKAQISTDEAPESFREYNTAFRLSVSQDIRTMPALDMNRIQQEDVQDEVNGLPPRFGYPHGVDLNLENSGRWQELSNGDKLWQLTIRCPQALSINLLYDRFWLPEGGKFFVYTTDRKHSIGAFTSVNNKGDRDNVQGFATGLLYGDEITLEYYQPRQVTEQAIISIAYVVQGYRYIELPSNMKTRDLGSSGSCQVNVNCPEGQNWQKEKNAVAMILVNGIRYCTGSLINTTANDNRPLFLTANHCLNGHDAVNNPILDHWSFWWHYETPNCNSVSTEPPHLSTVGATVIANNDASDFALLRLTEDPRNKRGVTPYYLGWDRSGNPGTGGVGIHHPNGDVKKISTYSCVPKNSLCRNSNYWEVNWIATGSGYSVMEPGSSGSPLINSNHFVIGQLYGPGICSLDQCNAPHLQNVAYGKFNISWTGNGALDSCRRLRDWLDPANINPQTWNGIGVINASPSISGSTVVCNQETYTIQNLPSGVSVQWSTSNGNLQLISGQGARTAVFRKNGSGECMIRARIASSTITYRVWTGVPSRVDYIEGMREGSQFKPNSTYVFSIENDPNSDNVTWAVGGGQIESGQGTNQIFVKTSDAGRFFIWARKRNRCGTGEPQI